MSININKYNKLQLRLRLNRRYIIKPTSIVLAAFALLATPATLLAQQPAPTTTADTTDKEVISVTVEAKADQTGKIIIGREDIELAPNPTGNINEILRTQSSIQFDQNSRNSMTGGDITPPRISIAGGNYYENNFLVDGISISNNLNPAGYRSYTSDGATQSPAGEAETMFIAPNLVESVTVYTANVPARYGSFTGGVISAKLRTPKTDGFHFSAEYRHTGDAWARQHYRPDDDLESHSDDESYQPQFTKDQYSLTVEGPLNKHIAAMLSYSENRAIIPLYDTTKRGEKHDTSRINRNLLFKLGTYNLDNFKAALTAIWAPYEGEYFAQSQRLNSAFTNKGGSYSVLLETENIFPLGILENTISFKHNDQDRTGEGAGIYSWRNNASNTYANWGTGTVATEGFAGNFTQKRNEYTIKPVFTFNTLGSGWFKNTIEIGAELTTYKQKSDQIGSTSYQWSTASTQPAPTATGPLNTNAIGDLKDGVITGEQWMNRRTITAPYHKDMTVSTAALFLEDTIKMERVSIRPSLRFSYDDISNNMDISPRLYANVDVFKNNLLNISAGAARYYGSQLLDYAFRNNTGWSAEVRTRWDQPWTFLSPPIAVAGRTLGELDTPYSEEFSLGAQLDIKKTIFRLQAIKRHNRDLIRADRDPDGTGANDRKFTNGGSSDYEQLTFEVQKNLNLDWAGKHGLKFSITWSKTENSSRQDLAYDEGANGISPIYALYNGELALKSAMPANNFNSPWVATFQDMMKFFNDRLRLYNNLRFEKGGDGVLYTGFQDTGSPDGRRLYKYIDGHQGDNFYYDLAVEYDLVKYKKSTLTLYVEVDNILDRKTLANTSTSATGGTYMMGRQFFAGVRFGF